MNGQNTRLWVTIASLLIASGSPISQNDLCFLARQSGQGEALCKPSNKEETEFVCEGADFVHWEPYGLPARMDTLTINGTNIATLPSCSFTQMSIKTLIIEDNFFLRQLDPNVFSGLEGVGSLVIRGNVLLDIPSPFQVVGSLSNLTSLILDGNYIQATEADSQPETDVQLEALEYVSLKGNPLKKIPRSFLEPLSDSSLTELVLEDCHLEFIDEGALAQLKDLKRIDLSRNYRLVQSNAKFSKWPSLSWTTVSFADNTLLELPIALMSVVNETLTTLDLSRNIFIELGIFPAMSKLNTLYLDDCSISYVHPGALENLVNLRDLYVRRNRFLQVPANLLGTSIKSLFFEGRTSLDGSPSYLTIAEETFRNMTNLESLTLGKFHLKGALHGKQFFGLTQLKSLDISFSNLEGITEDFLEYLTNLQNLTMAHCTGFESFPSNALRGPKSLEAIDLTSTSIFPKDPPPSYGNHGPSRDSPLTHIKTLILKNSMINVANAMDQIGLDKMPNLVKLDISANAIHNWNERKFEGNEKLEELLMTSIHDYISLTRPMIEDFQGLKLLDLSQNKFLCNEEIPHFYELAERNKNLTVVNWYLGFGYMCVEDPEVGNLTSFYSYSTGGQDAIDAYPNPDGDSNGNGAIFKGMSKNAVIGLIIGLVALFAAITLMVNFVYQNWWMVQFRLAKWKWLRNQKSTSDVIDKVYDAFVSYASEDHEWVTGILAPNLEPGYRLCLHERDFEVGRSITDNIVECMTKSKFCLVILSHNYITSNWCNFEAQIAHSMMKDRVTMIVLDAETTSNHNLSATLKALVKTRTFITWDETDAKFWRRIDRAMTLSESIKSLN